MDHVFRKKTVWYVFTMFSNTYLVYFILSLTPNYPFICQLLYGQLPKTSTIGIQYKIMGKRLRIFVGWSTHFMSIVFRKSNAENKIVPFKLIFTEYLSRKVLNIINISWCKLQIHLPTCSSKPNIQHRLLHEYMNTNRITIQSKFAQCVFSKW